MREPIQLKNLKRHSVVCKQAFVWYNSPEAMICTHRGVVTFAHKAKYYLTLPMPIISPKGHPLKPETIGEHIRKKSIDLGLLQRDIAEIIGTSKQTVSYWELGIT